MLVPVAVLFALAAFSILTKGCVSEAQIDRIEIGMSQWQVRELLGDPAEKLSIQRWKYYEGFFPVIIEFDGQPLRVVSK